ncbi:hypothetical protein V8C86DRAFT_2831358 [Haematococcus lacustris]
MLTLRALGRTATAQLPRTQLQQLQPQRQPVRLGTGRACPPLLWKPALTLSACWQQRDGAAPTADAAAVSTASTACPQPGMVTASAAVWQKGVMLAWGTAGLAPCAAAQARLLPPWLIACVALGCKQLVLLVAQTPCHSKRPAAASVHCAGPHSSYQQQQCQTAFTNTVQWACWETLLLARSPFLPAWNAATWPAPLRQQASQQGC